MREATKLMKLDMVMEAVMADASNGGCFEWWMLRMVDEVYAFRIENFYHVHVFKYH